MATPFSSPDDCLVDSSDDPSYVPDGSLIDSEPHYSAELQSLFPRSANSIISEAVHEKVLAHFSSLPSLRFPDEDNNRFEAFACNYSELFCAVAPEFPPPFQQIIEDYLLFYIDTIYPYFNQFQLGSLDPFILEDPRTIYFDMLHELGNKPTDSVVCDRWLCGLLRERQVQLVELVMRSLLKQLSVLLDVEVDNEERRLAEIGKAIYSTYHLQEFLCSRKFRSERLEILLLKYIAEDGVNMEVVRYIEAAQYIIDKQDGKIYDYSRWFK